MTAFAAAAPAAHPADPVTVILLAIAAAAAYAVSLYLHPLRTCPRCRGARITGTGRRGRMCARCAGTGRTRRIGATAVHRFYWSARGDQHMARRRHATTKRLRASYQDLLDGSRATPDPPQAREDPDRYPPDDPPDL